MRIGSEDRSSVMQLDPYYDDAVEIEVDRAIQEGEEEFLPATTDPLNEMGGSLDSFDATSNAAQPETEEIDKQLFPQGAEDGPIDEFSNFASRKRLRAAHTPRVVKEAQEKQNFILVVLP